MREEGMLYEAGLKFTGEEFEIITILIYVQLNTLRFLLNKTALFRTHL